jgi:4-hydroxy-2-oxoheptanedioate aldolase
VLCRVSTASISALRTSAWPSGGTFPGDPDVARELDAALVRIRKAAEMAGVVAAIHTSGREITKQRIADGFTFISVASDLTHLEKQLLAT